MNQIQVQLHAGAALTIYYQMTPAQTPSQFSNFITVIFLDKPAALTKSAFF